MPKLKGASAEARKGEMALMAQKALKTISPQDEAEAWRLMGVTMGAKKPAPPIPEPDPRAVMAAAILEKLQYGAPASREAGMIPFTDLHPEIRTIYEPHLRPGEAPGGFDPNKMSPEMRQMLFQMIDQKSKAFK